MPTSVFRWEELPVEDSFDILANTTETETSENDVSKIFEKISLKCNSPIFDLNVNVLRRMVTNLIIKLA